MKKLPYDIKVIDFMGEEILSKKGSIYDTSVRIDHYDLFIFRVDTIKGYNMVSYNNRKEAEEDGWII